MRKRKRISIQYKSKRLLYSHKKQWVVSMNSKQVAERTNNNETNPSDDKHKPHEIPGIIRARDR